MPRIYRSMTHENGIPLVGVGKNRLGVRVPPDPRADVFPDVEGNVHPESGGMSVAPSWRELPYFLIPKRLCGTVPEARGSNTLACFGMGEGDFARSSVTEDLNLCPTSAAHGTVDPARVMSLEQFLSAIADTRDQWAIDEG